MLEIEKPTIVTTVTYNLETVNAMTSILDTIANDTKSYTGLNLITMLGQLNILLNQGKTEQKVLTPVGTQNTENSEKTKSSLSDGGIIAEETSEDSDK